MPAPRLLRASALLLYVLALAPARVDGDSFDCRLPAARKPFLSLVSRVGHACAGLNLKMTPTAKQCMGALQWRSNGAAPTGHCGAAVWAMNIYDRTYVSECVTEYGAGVTKQSAAVFGFVQKCLHAMESKKNTVGNVDCMVPAAKPHFVKSANDLVAACADIDTTAGRTVSDCVATLGLPMDGSVPTTSCASAIFLMNTYHSKQIATCVDHYMSAIKGSIAVVDYVTGCMRAMNHDIQLKQKCAEVEWLGDGRCDKANNVEACQWDGGDCCPDTVVGGKMDTQYCGKNCVCKDPKSAHHKERFTAVSNLKSYHGPNVQKAAVDAPEVLSAAEWFTSYLNDGLRQYCSAHIKHKQVLAALTEEDTVYLDETVNNAVSFSLPDSGQTTSVVVLTEQTTGSHLYQGLELPLWEMRNATVYNSTVRAFTKLVDHNVPPRRRLEPSMVRSFAQLATDALNEHDREVRPTATATRFVLLEVGLGERQTLGMDMTDLFFGYKDGKRTNVITLSYVTFEATDRKLTLGTDHAQLRFFLAAVFTDPKGQSRVIQMVDLQSKRDLSEFSRTLHRVASPMAFIPDSGRDVDDSLGSDADAGAGADDNDDDVAFSSPASSPSSSSSSSSSSRASSASLSSSRRSSKTRGHSSRTHRASQRAVKKTARRRRSTGATSAFRPGQLVATSLATFIVVGIMIFVATHCFGKQIVLVDRESTLQMANRHRQGTAAETTSMVGGATEHTFAFERSADNLEL